MTFSVAKFIATVTYTRSAHARIVTRSVAGLGARSGIYG
jgi:hypothetical protein